MSPPLVVGTVLSSRSPYLLGSRALHQAYPCVVIVKDSAGVVYCVASRSRSRELSPNCHM